MAEWLMIFVLAGQPFAGGPYTLEDCLDLAFHHRAKFASNARCVKKDYPYQRVDPKPPVGAEGRKP